MSVPFEAEARAQRGELVLLTDKHKELWRLRSWCQATLLTGPGKGRTEDMSYIPGPVTLIDIDLTEPEERRET